MQMTMKMKMIDIQEKLYNKLKKLSPTIDDNFIVDILDESMPHKIGLSSSGYPMLFVECLDDKITTDINLKMFKVNFNRPCSLKENEKITSKKYCIIQLNSQNSDIQKYFLELTFFVLERLPIKPTVEGLKKELAKIISMFTTSSTLSKDVLKGLWAELLIIEQSKDCDYLVRAWHETPKDKYDFNDSEDKIEVKATGNEERIHHFAIEQLSPNENSQLLIASVIMVSSGLGKNIFELVDSIASRINDTDMLIKLKETVIKTIGGHIEDAQLGRYDYNYALQSIRWYNYKDIPTIKKEHIPAQLSRVTFSVCLKDIQQNKGIESVLFNKVVKIK